MRKFLFLFLLAGIASASAQEPQPPYIGEGKGQARSAAAVRMDNGNNGTYTDAKGNVWVSDVGFYNGNNKISTCVPNPTTAGTADPVLFKTQRYGIGTGTSQDPYLTYTIKSLLVGQYTVNLYFSECSFNAAGARQFNVFLQGTQVLTNFDIFVAAGNKQNTAVVKSFPAMVPSNGQIVIKFTPGYANNPTIAAIEILPAGDNQPPVVTIVSPVLGTITQNTFIQANVTDDSAVVGVTGTIDNIAMVLTAQAGPLYTFSTNLATLPLGNHVVTIQAKDLAGNIGSTTMNFNNSMVIALVAMPTQHRVTLNWIPGVPTETTAIATGYNVYRKFATDANYSNAPVQLGSVTTFVDATVGSGISYVYKVTATSSGSIPSESSSSNEVVVTIPAP